MENEKIYDVFWEGPFSWDEKESHVKKHHVLYQLYGSHHHYGRDILLYIGSTEKGIQRFEEHDSWVEYEYDDVRIRLGSIGEFATWKDWKKNKKDYKKATRAIIKKIESLLIFANQPVYNLANKSDANTAKNIRIFNSGKLGQLFPEISYKYFLESK